MKKSTILVCLIFTFFLSAFALISSGRFGGDGLENYFTAESIVLDGDFSINDRPFGVQEMSNPKKDIVNTGAKRYSQYGLGVAFLLVPFYSKGHLLSKLIGGVPHDYITQFVVSFFNPLVLALVALFLFKLLVKSGYSNKISFLTTLIYSFCTMNVVYARSGFSEPVVALLVLICVTALLDYSKNRKVWSLIVAAFAIGYVLFIKKNSFILFPAVGGYFLCLSVTDKEASFKNKIGHLLSFALPVLLSIIAIIIQNKVLYGGVLHTEYGSVKDVASLLRTDGSIMKGLYYFLISPGKGYIFYNIAIVLGFFAIKDFFRKDRIFSVFIFTLLLSNLLVYSFIFVRGSLFSWGPRYLFPTLPLAALFLAEFMAKNNTFKRKVSIFAFAIVGFLIQLPNFFISFSKYLFFVKEKFGLSEYLVDFMPELSPIKGAWALVLSLINRSLGGGSLSLSFNPDLWFFTTTKASLEGYDVLDICWANIVKVNSSMIPYVAVAVCAIVTMGVVSLYKISAYLKGRQ